MSTPSRLTTFSPYSIVTVAVFLTYAAACLHGIANDWQWGHNGYNGAAFCQAAKNSLRFQTIGMAQYHTGLAPPKPSSYYTHHPMMLHFHLISVISLFGYSEAACRSIPALYSFLDAVMVFIISRRFLGPHAALASLIAYVLLPMNLIFANMPNHEQGSIFWILFYLYTLLRWLEDNRPIHLILSLVAISIAIQFDWVGYYIAFLCATYVFLSGARKHRGILDWRREYTYSALLSVIVLANFFLFYSYIIDLRGGFNEMKSAFLLRSSSPRGYYKRLLERSLDLYGVLPLLILATWLAIFPIRSVRSRLEKADLIAGFLFVAQAIHSLLFKQAGHIHSYWTYHLNPALAIMIGQAAVFSIDQSRRLGQWIADRMRRHRGPFRTPRPGTLTLITATLIIGLPAVAQARHSWEMLRWGFRTGSASYYHPYTDQYLDVQWAKDLRRRFPRGTARFLIHRSLPWRIEVISYLDSPYQKVRAIPSAPNIKAYREAGRDLDTVLLVDIKKLSFWDLQKVGQLVTKHPTIVYDRKFVTINLSHDVDKPKIESLVHVEHPASWWWKWLVNPDRPPVEWRHDPEGGMVREMFPADVRVMATRILGGVGGRPRVLACGQGEALYGIVPEMTSEAEALVYVKPKCKPLRDGVPELPSRTAETNPASAKNYTSRTATLLQCPPGRFVVGIGVWSGRVVHGLQLLCSSPSMGTSSQGDAASSTTQNALDDSLISTPVAGVTRGRKAEYLCPSGTVGWGLPFRHGALLDAVGLSCVAVDELDPQHGN